MHVRGEAGHHEFLGSLAEDPLQCGLDVLLGKGEAGHIGVGGVGHQQVDPPLITGQPREPAQVSDPLVERQLIHLEVAGMQHHAGAGLDRDGQRIRDRMVDREELQLERAGDHRVTLDHLVIHGGIAQPVFAQLAVHERQGQLAAVKRDVLAAAQQVGHRADVILVAVGEHEADDVVQPIVEVIQPGQDQIDAGLVVLGEQDPTVHHQQFAVDLEDGHVSADVAEPTEWDDAQGVGGQPGRRLKCTHIAAILTGRPPRSCIPARIDSATEGGFCRR
ncbi:hypothetical protein SDC9_107546 [bioreactor metagenome]|uniref:Uncharacterized protein n=1 Tax=bioreactor metagenome TaxID=1076179 RepID=A0A645BG49_9ZZZZ